MRIKKILLGLLIFYLIGTALHGLGFSINVKNINVFKNEPKEFDFTVHSDGYMLVDISDNKVLYAHNTSKQIYPASLTKILTLDAVLHLEQDLTKTSYVADRQVEALIKEDASLAYIQRDYNYSLQDLLYALILPSGADAAIALENYFISKGIDLVEKMNELASELGCKNSHFTNTTGLHDDSLYTSIDDLYLIVMDTLKNETGRKILTSLNHTLEDGTYVSTGIRLLNFNDNDTIVLGGKTGYTDEAGQNIITLYRNKGKSYALFFINAYGRYSHDEYWHYEDCLTVFEHLY